jgi:hypothetical protein
VACSHQGAGDRSGDEPRDLGTQGAGLGFGERAVASPLTSPPANQKHEESPAKESTSPKAEPPNTSFQIILHEQLAHSCSFVYSVII